MIPIRNRHGAMARCLRPTRLALACAAALATLLPPLATPARAAELHWRAPSPNTRWLDAANWLRVPPGGGIPLPGIVPGAADTVLIELGDVLVDGSAQTGPFELHSGFSRLTIAAAGALTMNAAALVRGPLDVFGALSVTAGNSLTVETPTVTFEAGSRLLNEGTVRVLPGGVLTFLSGSPVGAAYSGGSASLLEVAGGKIMFQSALDVTRLRLAPDSVTFGNFDKFGAIGGSGALTVKSFEWGHGTIGDAATPGMAMTVTESATIGHLPIFAQLSQTGATPIVRHGAHLTLAGTTRWAYGVIPITIEGPTALAGGTLGAASRITVAAGATFEDLGQPTDQAYRHISGQGLFEVLGTYRKSGAGLTLVDSGFRNTGILRVDGGTLLLAGDPLHTDALIAIAPGATLRQFNGLIGGTTVIRNDGTFALDGAARIGSMVTFESGAGGRLDLLGYAMRVDANIAGGAVLLNGSLSGAGTVTAGALTWRSGSIGNEDGTAGAIVVRGAAVLATDSILHLERGSSLRLEGETTWAQGQSVRTGLGFINLRRGAAITVAAGATFNDLGELANAEQRRIFSPDFGFPGSFVNEGTYRRRDGSGATVVQTDFTNRGLVDVQAGTMYFAFGLESSGAFSTAVDARLLIAGNAHLGAGSGFSNKGTFEIRGTARIDADLTIGGMTELRRGTIHGSGNLRLASLEWDGGLFGNPNVPGSSNGSVTVDGATNLSGIDHLVTDGYQVTLNGATRFQPGRRVILGNNATLGVGADGIFNDMASSDRTIVGNPGSRFVNAGTYVKSGIGGITTVTAPFFNTGQVRVDEGRLELVAGGEFRSGELKVAPLASSALNGVAFRAGSSIRNDGVVQLTSSRLDAGSSYVGGASARIDLGVGRTTIDIDLATSELRLLNDIFNPGAVGLLVGNGTVTTGRLVWQSGAWMGEPANPGGKTIVLGAASLTGVAAAPNAGTFRLEGSRVLQLNGRTTWANGAPSIEVGNFNPVTPAARLEIGRGGVFEDQGGYDPTGRRIVGAGIVVNNGTYLRTGIGNDSTFIGTGFINRGKLDLRAGEMRFAGSFDNAASGVIDAQPGTYLRIDNLASWEATGGALRGGQYVVRAGAAFNVGLGIAAATGLPAAIRRNEASITLDGAGAELTSLAPSFGSLPALGSLRENAGTLVVQNGATLATDASLANSGRILVGAGSVLSVSGALVQDGSGATLDVLGTLNAGALTFRAGTLGTGADHAVGRARFGSAPVSFSGAAMLQVDVDSDTGASDWFDFAGAVQLGGRLEVSFGGNGAHPGRFRVLSAAAGVTGEFDAVGVSGIDRAAFTVGLERSAGEVFLTLAPVPEPQEWTLLLAGVGVLGAVVRRRRSRAAAPGR